MNFTALVKPVAGFGKPDEPGPVARISGHQRCDSAVGIETAWVSADRRQDRARFAAERPVQLLIYIKPLVTTSSPVFDLLLDPVNRSLSVSINETPFENLRGILE